MAAAKKDSKPAKDFDVILQGGLKAKQLADKYQVDLAPRLDANLLATLADDVTKLGAVVPAAKKARDGAVQSTATQNVALDTGYDYVTATRTAVARKKPDSSVLLGYGVGTRTNKTVVKDVKVALQTIIDRATKFPAEAQGFGIIQADVDAMKKQIDAIDTADTEQEKARASAPLTTKERNTVARRILDAIDTIAGAGILAFATKATERAQFEALIKKGK